MLKIRAGVKTISKDALLNLIASVLTIAVIHFVVYPLLGIELSDAEYGRMLLVMAVADILCGSAGATLNNARLIMHGEHHSEGMDGDYRPILLVLNILAVVVFVGYCAITGYVSPVQLVLVSMYIVLNSSRAYMMASFRIWINFRKILLCSVFVAAGSLAGAMVYMTAGLNSLWPVPFVVGELFGCAYCIFSTSFLKEKFSLTSEFKVIVGIESSLLISGVISNILNYLDRLIIQPMIDESAVSVYTVASRFGKVLGLVIAPIAGVLLGHFTQGDFRLKRKDYWTMNSAVLAMGVVFIGMATLIGRPVIGFFYPTKIDQAVPYMFGANLAAVLAAMTSIALPAVLRYAPTYWQVIVQTLQAMMYIGLGYVGVQKNGLTGFIMALIISNLIKLIALYWLGDHYIRQSRNSTGE